MALAIDNMKAIIERTKRIQELQESGKNLQLRPQQAEAEGYDTRLKELYSQIGARPAFSYDPEGDMLYGQYKTQYTDQGRMAMMDSMGQAAGLTGGYGSSYASAVGQQQYNSYLQQLNDVLPQLYSAAAEQYSRETADLYELYGLNSDARKQAYDNTLYMISATGYAPTKQEQADSGLSPEQVRLLRIKYYKDNKLPLPEDLGGKAASSGGGRSFDYFKGDGGTVYNPYGYDNAADKSQLEVQRIQADLGITADGIWGPSTERAYKKAHG